MKLRMDLDWLKKQSVFIATPAYGDMCASQHHLAILHLSHLFNQYGITHHVSTNPDSLVTRARNRMAWKFLQGTYTHMLFIDSDIYFYGGDVVHMLVLSQEYPGILGAPYAKKEINWERVREAAMKGVPAKDLAACGANLVLNWSSPPERLSLDRPNDDIRELGTGYMLVPRNVMTTMLEKKIVEPYNLMPAEVETFKTKFMYPFFLDPIDPETKFHLSEDWYFCRKWLQAGGKVWLCPWMRSHHVGTYEYIADIPTMARADVAI